MVNTMAFSKNTPAPGSSLANAQQAANSAASPKKKGKPAKSSPNPFANAAAKAKG